MTDTRIYAHNSSGLPGEGLDVYDHQGNLFDQSEFILGFDLVVDETHNVLWTVGSGLLKASASDRGIPPTAGVGWIEARTSQVDTPVRRMPLISVERC